MRVTVPTCDSKVATATGNGLRGCASESVSGETTKPSFALKGNPYASGTSFRPCRRVEPSPSPLEQQRGVVGSLHAELRLPSPSSETLAEDRITRRGDSPSRRSLRPPSSRRRRLAGTCNRIRAERGPNAHTAAMVRTLGIETVTTPQGKPTHEH